MAKLKQLPCFAGMQSPRSEQATNVQLFAWSKAQLKHGAGTLDTPFLTQENKTVLVSRFLAVGEGRGRDSARIS